jgi:hypothetical protein
MLADGIPRMVGQSDLARWYLSIGVPHSVHQCTSLNLTLNGFMLSIASSSATSFVTPPGYLAAISVLYA